MAHVSLNTHIAYRSRRVHWIAFWLSLVTFANGVVSFGHQIPGQVLDGIAGHVFGAVAMATGVAIWVSLRKWDQGTLHATYLAGIIWFAMSSILFIDAFHRVGPIIDKGDWWRVVAVFYSPFVALCWAGIAWTSWWVDRRQTEEVEGDG